MSDSNTNGAKRTDDSAKRDSNPLASIGAGLVLGGLVALGGFAATVGAAAALYVCAPLLPHSPRTVLIGLDCMGEAVQVYGEGDGREAAKACMTVERHAMPGER